MDGLALGLVGGVLANTVYWSILLLLARPRISFSQHVVHDSSVPGCLRVKVRNELPWSVQGLEFSALLVSGTPDQRRYVPLVVHSPSQPILGGWFNARFRRVRYGWLGASHRVVTIERGQSLSAMPYPDSVVAALEGGDEMIVSIRGTDGALLALSRWAVRAYRMEDLATGRFQKGRSLSVRVERVVDV